MEESPVTTGKLTFRRHRIWVLVVIALLLTNGITILLLVSKGGGTTSPPGPPAVLDYGPKEYKSGVAFNAQPGGDSAVWVHVAYGGSLTDLSLAVNGSQAGGIAVNPEQKVLSTLVPKSVVAAGSPIEIKVVSVTGSSSMPVYIKVQGK